MIDFVEDPPITEESINEKEKERLKEILQSLEYSWIEDDKVEKETTYKSNAYHFVFDFETTLGKASLFLDGYLEVKVRQVDDGKPHSRVTPFFYNSRIELLPPSQKKAYTAHPYLFTQEYKAKMLYNKAHRIKDEIELPPLTEEQYILNKEELKKYEELRSAAIWIMRGDPIMRYHDEANGLVGHFKKARQEIREEYRHYAK